MGAKALLLKTKRPKSYVVCVLPGSSRLDQKAAKAFVGSFRFSTADEMNEITGLAPGSMPPFGPELFPGVINLVVDTSLKSESVIGFNAAEPTSSVVMTGADYLKAVAGTAVVGNICRTTD